MTSETHAFHDDTPVVGAEKSSEAARSWLSRSAVVAVATTVVAAFGLYAFLATTVVSPRSFADELLYFDTAGSIADGDGLTIRGEAYRYSPLYPVLLAPILALTADREIAYELAKLLNALLLALAAVPVFLLARRILPPWPSVAAAAFSVAIPSATYVSVVMTESLAYLAFAWALYAIALALERPSVPRQVAALLAILVATGVRTQFVLLLGVLVAALVAVLLLVPERRSQARSIARSLWPTALALGLGALALGAVRVVGASDGGLGAYSALWTAYDPVDVAKWLAYHLANVELYLAVIPLAVAPIALAAGFSRARAGSERHAAFVVLFLVANATLLLLAAAFNSTEYATGRFHDRPSFYVVPLWLIVLFAWLADGAPRPLAATAGGLGLALVLPLFLPFETYARDDAVQQFNAVSTTLWASVAGAFDDAAVSGFGVLVIVTALLVLAVVLVPRRHAWLLAGVVLAFFVLSSQLNWNVAARVSKPWEAALPDTARFWLDERVPHGRSITLLTLLSGCNGYATRDTFYLSEFFNERVQHAAHLNARPDVLPAARARVGSDGRVLDETGAPVVADYVVAPSGMTLRGRLVHAESDAALVLWEIAGPVRVLGASSSNDVHDVVCAAVR